MKSINLKPELSQLLTSRFLPYSLGALVLIHGSIIIFAKQWDLSFFSAIPGVVTLLAFTSSTYFVFERIRLSKRKANINTLTKLIVAISIICAIYNDVRPFQRFIFPGFSEYCQLAWNEGLQMVIFCSLGFFCTVFTVTTLFFEALGTVASNLSRNG